MRPQFPLLCHMASWLHPEGASAILPYGIMVHPEGASAIMPYGIMVHPEGGSAIMPYGIMVHPEGDSSQRTAHPAGGYVYCSVSRNSSFV